MEKSKYIAEVVEYQRRIYPNGKPSLVYLECVLYGKYKHTLTLRDCTMIAKII